MTSIRIKFGANDITKSDHSKIIKMNFSELKSINDSNIIDSLRNGFSKMGFVSLIYCAEI